MSTIHMIEPALRVVMDYPTPEWLLSVDIDHVRVIDEIRLHFDFEAHEWVVEMEIQAKDNLSAPTGKWVEVARWSGNGPVPCPTKLDCGGNCRLQAGHEPPCLCVGDVDGPDTCPA